MSDAKVTIFAEKLAAIDEAARRALEKTAAVIRTEVAQAQVIPRREGILQHDTSPDFSQSAEGHVEVASSTPYARRLYYHPEYNFSKEENPNAGAEWFAPWAEGGDRENVAATTFAVLFKREAGL